jgi:single-stranded-DNA-specific exonuclease
VEIIDVASISDGKHIKFKTKEKGAGEFFYSVYFGMSHDSFRFTSGDICDIVFSAEINEHFKNHSVQLFIKQVRPCESDNEHFEKVEKYIASENEFPYPAEYIPTLDDFRIVFKYMKNEFSQGHPQRVSLTYLRRRVLRDDGSMIPLPALKVILEVFEENNLAKCKFHGDGFVAEVTMLPSGGKKIDLEKSKILAMVKGN